MSVSPDLPYRDIFSTIYIIPTVSKMQVMSAASKMTDGRHVSPAGERSGGRDRRPAKTRLTLSGRYYLAYSSAGLADLEATC